MVKCSGPQFNPKLTLSHAAIFADVFMHAHINDTALDVMKLYFLGDCNQ